MRSSEFGNFAGTDRFSILRRLGAGGMGVVYEAFDHERNQRIALKTVTRRDPSSLYRFKKEFRAIADIAHPNLVRLEELFCDDDQWFFTMELVEGADFLRFVCPDSDLPEDDPLSRSEKLFEGCATAPTAIPGGDRTTQTAAPGVGNGKLKASTASALTEPETTGDEAPDAAKTELDPSQAYPASSTEALPLDGTAIDSDDRGVESTEEEVPPGAPAPAATASGGSGRPARRPHLVRLRAALRQVAEALNELHTRGKLHRDIKPSNVLVTRRGRVVLLDFGLSTEMDGQAEALTAEGYIVGTATYMSPEQAAGDPLMPASDWYGVGVMLYRALTGRLPFAGRSLDVLMEKQRVEPPPPSALVPDVPEDLNTLCAALLRLRPEHRPTGAEVLLRLGATAPGSVLPASRRLLFVGREEQLAALAEAFATVRDGRAVSVFVKGRSGVGKSSLVQRFLDGLIERNEAVVLAGRCYEQESVAYKALDSLIDALSRYLRSLSRLKVDALLPRDVAALGRVFPVLGRVDAVADAPQRVSVTPDRQELRRRAFAALREMLARISDRQPLVLFIDDLQWGDLDSAAFLSDLIRPPDPPLLLLIGSYRSEYAAASPCLRELLATPGKGEQAGDRRELAVEPLNRQEGRELALALIGQGDAAARSVADLVVREAGGSPYFVYELIQYLQEGNEIVEGQAVSGESVSLDEVLWRRIGRLPREAVTLLEALAVAGRPLRQAIACRVTGLGAEGFSALALLRTNHLIRGTGPGALDDVEAYHDRIRETVARRLSPAQAADWHRALARELEGSGDADPEMLAVHFDRSDDAEKAGHYYVLAADEVAEMLAFDRAVTLYRRALELRPAGDAESWRLRTRLGDALANAGRSDEAARVFLEAAAAAPHAELLELQRRAAYQFLIGGHIDEGLSSFSTILDRVGLPLPRTPRRALFRLLFSRAQLRLRGLGFRERPADRVDPARLKLIDISRSVAVGISMADVIRGSDYQTRSLLLALRAGEPFRIALALGWEAVHSACVGRPARRRSARLIAEADALARRIGHPHALGMAALSAGAAEFLEGRYRTAVELTDRAEAIFCDGCTGVVWELDTARIFGLWSLFYLGRIAVMRERSRRVFAEAGERGDRYLLATPGPFVATVARLADDDVEAARETAREALGRWSQRGFHIQHLNFYYGNLYADLYDGDAPRAWSRIGETASPLNSSLLLRIQQVRIDVLQHGGRCAVAIAAGAADPGPLLLQADRYARRLDRERVSWSGALARVIRAGAAAVRGDSTTAASLLSQAVEECEAADIALFAAAARRQLGRLLGGDEGRDHVARADTWMHSQSIRNPARFAACLVPGFSVD